MATESRVLDTNVIISAVLFKQSPARHALEAARTTGDIVLSLPVIEELNRVLSRKKFDRYITQQERLRFLATFVQASRMVSITERIQVCRDPKDDKFLELAIAGKAATIISGDDDLLVSHPFRDVAILTPRQFLDGLPNSM